MLSAAHVLAMDAKNLLDVIDSIRSRFPNLFEQNRSSNKSTPNNSATSSPSRKISRPQGSQAPPPVPAPNRVMSPSTEVAGGAVEENQYQNLGHFNLPSVASPAVPVTPETTSQPESMYANEQQQHLVSQTKALELGDEKRTPLQRPQVATKPFNFNIVKVKSNFGGSGGAANELKIIEDDLYPGDNENGAGAGSGGPTESGGGGGSNGGIKLPEPVSCSIVQENIFKKNQSMLHK